ncbi:unnamed protein product [Linum trigynum]|uniref:Uncharacterized protein n=1 Tax=Linum trigynum TaxID=586398 RepID=A0AAV2CFH8_9ROSI
MLATHLQFDYQDCTDKGEACSFGKDTVPKMRLLRASHGVKGVDRLPILAIPNLIEMEQDAETRAEDGAATHQTFHYSTFELGGCSISVLSLDYFSRQFEQTGLQFQ